MNVFIENVQILTKEWIDVLIFIDNKNCFRMYCTEEKGTYKFIDNKLIVEWEKWGIEIFEKKTFGRNHCVFIHIDNQCNYEIPLITNEWNDIGVIDFDKKILFRKNYPIERGRPLFEKNKLHIFWEKYGQETFYFNCHGKYYVNSKISYCNVSSKKEVKPIAIVFPQFHEIPENNQFWGEGFTEWSLLSKIPDEVHGELIKKPHQDIGYYNILDYSHRLYMKAIADKYNIYGFCYYHYWFKNKKVMYKPLEMMLNDGQPDKPFMFCWANEQWTRRWDGGNDEVLLEQDYSDEQGNIEHFNYLLQFFKHKNYIREKNRPIFIFYRIEEKDIESIKKIIYLWNELSKKNGLPSGIHFMRFLGPFDNRFNIEEIEGGIEFEPGYATSTHYTDVVIPDNVKIFDDYDEILYLQKNRDVRQMILQGKHNQGYEHYVICGEKEKDVRRSEFFLYDGNTLYDKIVDLPKIHDIQHRGINVQWNNVPRRNYTNGEFEKYPHIFKYINPENFGNTTSKLLEKINNDPNPVQDFLFLSSWNEWNEQCVLEPNNIDGYDYLSSFQRKYLEHYNSPKRKSILVFGHIGGGTYKHMKDIEYIFPEYEFIYYNQFDKPIDILQQFSNINAIHIHSFLLQSFVSGSPSIPNSYTAFVEKIKQFKEKNPKTIIYLTIHDYQWLFPENPNIIAKDYSNINPEDIHINYFNEICSLVNKIIFPDSKIISQYQTKISLEKYFSKISVVPHMDILHHHNNKCIPQIDNCIRIAFVGNFCNYKGANSFIELSKNKKSINIDGNDIIIEYHIFGFSEKEITPDMPIFYHGNYEEKNLIGYLHHKKIHGICHISEFDESYCYALTYSILSGLPICYNENGCFQSRLGGNQKYMCIFQDRLINDFDNFLNYIYNEQNKIFYNEQNTYKNNMSDKIQPNKWYISNYMEEIRN